MAITDIHSPLTNDFCMIILQIMYELKHAEDSHSI